MLTVSVECNVCTHQDSTTVTANELQQYFSGTYVQDVWPDKTQQEREIIMASRTNHYLCEQCWNVIFDEHPQEY